MKRGGGFGVYQSVHPDERAQGHHPFLLFLETKPIGVIRIDLPGDKNEAIFRRVAIALDFQRQGHGTALMQEAEAFAAAHQRFLFIANVALDAIPFYEKIGYMLDPNSAESDPHNPRMTKMKTLPKPVGQTQ